MPEQHSASYTDRLEINAHVLLSSLAQLCFCDPFVYLTKYVYSAYFSTYFFKPLFILFTSLYHESIFLQETIDIKTIDPLFKRPRDASHENQLVR